MLPREIVPCPIIDAVIEIRFKSDLFSNAVFGVIYNVLKSEFQNPEKLPILQIPEQLRDIDPNFKFKPHYKIQNQTSIIQIGPDVLSISSPIPYIGWDAYSLCINKYLQIIISLNVISEVSRLGMRYISFFQSDIFQSINLNVEINDKRHNCHNSLFRTELQSGTFTNTLQIANNVTQVINNQTKIGSVIDIDTNKMYNGKDFLTSYSTEIQNAHLEEKQLFFGLLKPDFLKSLNPVYDK
jgi:uncharacterized protein (TIGR04255 family)